MQTSRLFFVLPGVPDSPTSNTHHGRKGKMLDINSNDTVSMNDEPTDATNAPPILQKDNIPRRESIVSINYLRKPGETR